MKPKNFLPPVMAILGGAVGFGLRKWQLSTGFEADTGLAVPGAPAAMVLILWSALMAAGILVLIRKYKGPAPPMAALGGGERNTVYLTVILFSAVLLLVSAGFEVLAFSVNGQNSAASDTVLAKAAGAALPPLRIALCAGGLFAVGLWGRSVYQGGEGRKESLSLLELCLLLCLWLISDYQTRTADPVIFDYLYEVFAIVTVLLGLYYLAGFSFANPQPRRALFLGLMGPYFSLVTLADSHSLADVFRYGFAVLFLTAHAALILNPLPAGEAPAEAETEVDENA